MVARRHMASKKITVGTPWLRPRGAGPGERERRHCQIRACGEGTGGCCRLTSPSRRWQSRRELLILEVMRTRDKLGDAMRRLVSEANEVAAQRGFPSKVLFAPGPGSPEDEQDIRSLNTARRRFEAGIIEWGPLRYDVTILSGALRYVDDVAVIYCDIPGGDLAHFRKLSFDRIAELLETAQTGIEYGDDCFLAVYTELVLDGCSGKALLNTLLRLTDTAARVGRLLERWRRERRRKQPPE